MARASATSWSTADVAHSIGNLLDARDHQALPFFDGLDVARRLHQRRVRAGIEPGGAASETLDVQLPASR